eukprot:COSAG02_NODE_3761_length_6272_cov_5.833468_5_plen_39_part_00
MLHEKEERRETMVKRRTLTQQGVVPPKQMNYVPTEIPV